MMIVVGILAILMAVAFIGITGYLRSMTKLEYDGYAREIFVAAQNHLAVAENQGYYGFTDEPYAANDKRTDFGFPENDATSPGVYYFVVLPEDDVPEDDGYYNPDDSTHSTLLGQMLPFGSVEETVRKGNSGYIIRYHKDSAQVLDVFYWTQSGSRYSHTYADGDYDYGKFFDAEDEGKPRKAASRNRLRTYGDEKSVIGYYGGEDAAGLEKGDEIKAPEIQVVNEDKLYVRIKENNDDKVKNKGGYTLKLVVTGKTSGAKKEVELYSTPNGSEAGSTGTSPFIVKNSGPYVVVLDDVTEAGRHFADFASDITAGDGVAGKQLIPGEDVSIQAVASNNAVLTNVAYSSQQTTNSLFGIGTSVNGKASKAYISSIRHLENLDYHVSDVNAETAEVKFREAEQVTDISWTAFQNNIFENINKKEFGLTPAGKSTGVGVYGSTTNKIAGTDTKPVSTVAGSGEDAKGYFYPITINTSDMHITGNQWIYDGKNHSISDVEVNLPSESLFSGAGLFAELTGEGTPGGQKYAVQNLQLIDFSVKSEKAGADAGALAGKISQAEVTNVVAFHKTKEGDNANPDNADPTGIAATKSVSGAANAGGLVGHATNSNLYKSAAALKVSTSGNNGGGLVGLVDGTSKIISCFSGGHTIDGEYKPDHGSGDDKVTNDYNVKAALNAGGLIGKADESGTDNVTTIRYSYSTCSAMATGTDGGTAVGGLLGRLVNGKSTVNFCYATGLVKANAKAETSDGEAPKVGAFIGDLPNESGKVGDSYYYQIINKTTEADGTVSYLPQLGSEEIEHQESLVAAIDKSADGYNDFVGASGSWSSSYSYDAKLKVFYQGKYNLETTNQLRAKRTGTSDPYNGEAVAGDFVLNHYGDWPAPETWVFNTKD